MTPYLKDDLDNMNFLLSNSQKKQVKDFRQILKGTPGNINKRTQKIHINI
jgi:hypothetical protein